jgi:hypothetical protein
MRILERQEAGYPVEITVNNELEFPRGYLDPTFLPWVASTDPAQDGVRLFQWLLADSTLQRAWAETRGQAPARRLRLRIDASAPELHVIPWEALRDPADGVVHDLAASVNTPFSRYLSRPAPPGSPLFQRPIKVLVALANPANLPDFQLQAVEVEQEWALLQAATQGLAVELVRLTQPCTLPALAQALKAGIHVLHLVGHGSYNSRTQEAALLLADEQNQVRLVKENELAELLNRQLSAGEVANEHKLRLVFLAACQTATRHTADALRGFAPQLIQAGVPAVLAMQENIPVETARRFAQTFYRQLLEHGQVDLACNEARSLVISTGLSGAAIPVLLMRLRDGMLLGQPGRISNAPSHQAGEQPVDHEEDFWQPLLADIFYGKCLPFLGPGVLQGLLPDRAAIASKLADQLYDGAPERNSLVRVAQYAALNDAGGLRDNYLRILQESLLRGLGLRLNRRELRQYANQSLTALTSQLNWAEKMGAQEESEVHHLLAALELPIYLTTNPDAFMSEALKARGATPQRLGPRWKKPEAGAPQWVLPGDPSPAQPLVFHLTGYDGDPEQQQNLLLSEDDYLAFLVRLTRDQEQLLPANLLTAFATHSFLFLGYQLDDWDFRTILLGILQQIEPSKRKMHVGVQLDPAHGADVEKSRRYLELYLGKFNIAIYWGAAKAFASELHSRWQRYLEQGDDH